MNSVGKDDLGSLSCFYLLNMRFQMFTATSGFMSCWGFVCSQREVTVWGNVFPLKWSEEYPWALAQVAPLLSSTVAVFEAHCDHHLVPFATLLEGPVFPFDSSLPEARENWAIVSWGFL